jgi:NADH-quinone oxidoreductase subunit N
MIHTPHVDWFSLSTILALLGASGIALLSAVLVPRSIRRGFAASVAALGCVGGLVTSIWLYVDSANGQRVIGDAFYRDRWTALAQAILCGIGLCTVLLATEHIPAWGRRAPLKRRDDHIAEFFALLLACIAGMAFFVGSANLMTLFLSLEWFSIALYVMCAIDYDREGSLEAGLKYLIVGSFGSAGLLFGSALVYGATRSIGFEEIAHAVGQQNLSGDALLVLGLAMIIAGIGFKASAAPFHMWTPDVYQGAPIPVTAFMSVGTKAAGFAMIIRIFAGGLPHLAPEWQVLLAFVAATSMIVGNLMAIVQSSLKRLLAYSGIAQAGYVLIGVIAGGQSGLAAVLFYLFVYMFMNFGAFAVVTMLAGPEGDRDRLSDLDGLYRRSPLMAILMTVFMLSLAGFPPFVGFFGKLFLFTAGVSAGYTWLVVLAVLMSVVSVYYYVRVLIPVWSSSVRTDKLESSVSSTMAIALSGALSLLLGLYPTTVLIASTLGVPISFFGP